MRRLLFSLLVMTTLPACGKKTEPAAATQAAKAEAPKAEAPKTEAPKAEPPKPDGTPVPNSDGLVAEVPAGAVPNGIGGAAGFHSEDNSFEFQLNKQDGEEAAKTIAAKKAETEQILFEKWLRADATADGWVLVWVMPKMDLSTDPPKEVGKITAFQVRRKIGAQVYDCNGGLEKAEGLDAALAACQSVRKP